MAQPIQRICAISGEPFEISELEQELIRKFDTLPPTRSPKERMRHLAAFNNYMTLHRGKCSATGESVIQVYRPSAPFPVYSLPYWWSDEWDARSYARPYDFSRTFFEQFADLLHVVPWPALSLQYLTNENCDYVSGVSYSKNCYLIFSSIGCEDCLFGYMNRRSRDCLDCSLIFDSELCYDSVFVFGSYELRHSFNCRSCRSSAFLRNCVGCQDCFGCVNLNQGRFVYFNEQLTEEAYRSRMSEIAWDEYSAIEALKVRFREHCQNYQDPSIRGMFLENAGGDFIDHCQDAAMCFQGAELQSCVNCLQIEKGKDCLNMYTWGAGSEMILNGSRVGTNAYNLRNCFLVYSGSSDVEYSMMCTSSKNCFGCIGMRNAEYSILNQPYSRSEYHELRARIVTQMRTPQNGDPPYGEFFPLSLSLYPYNDSDANFYFPLDQKEISRIGARFEEPLEGKVAPTKSWDSIPQRTSDVPSDITEETLACVSSGKPYRILARELAYYKSHSIALPRKHWLSRLIERFEQASLSYTLPIRQQ